MGIKPYTFGDEPKRRVKKLSTQKEKKWSKKVKGKVQPASGATWHSKGDVKETLTKPEELFYRFLWDHKYTSNKTFRIDIDKWEDLRLNAFKAGGYLPGMVIELTSRKTGKSVELVVMEREDFMALKEMADLAIKEETE